jgi:fucose 4-O-acetylase-like acetyltransferase
LAWQKIGKLGVLVKNIGIFIRQPAFMFVSGYTLGTSKLQQPSF